MNQNLNGGSSNLTEDEKQLIIQIKHIYDGIAKTAITIKYKIGKEINTFHKKEYGQDNLQKIADNTGINKKTLYTCCKLGIEFTDDDIDSLSNRKEFTPSLKSIRDNLSLGRDKIMTIFKESKNGREFNQKLATVRKQAMREKQENSPLGRISPTEEDKNVNEKSDTNSIFENQNNNKKDEELLIPENHNVVIAEGEKPKEDEFLPDTNASVQNDNKFSKGGENLDNLSSDSDEQTANEPKPDSSAGMKNDDTTGAEKQPSSIDDIKRNSGVSSSFPATTPLGQDSKYNLENLMTQQNAAQPQPPNINKPVLIAEDQLQKLREENEALRQENEKLKQENLQLKQLVKQLSGDTEPENNEVTKSLFNIYL